MLCLGLVVLFAGANLALPSSKAEPFDLEKAAEYFEQFIIDFGREYNDEEEKSMRFENFKKHLVTANERNMGSDEAVHGITMFADYTEQERAQLRSCHLVKDMFEETLCQEGELSWNVTDAPPSAFDWRDKKMVSPVKDQAGCGSCWAFSAVGNLESAYALKHNGEILDLSEQELVDCDTNSLGCGGALRVDAGLSAFLKLGGAQLEADYPYTARDQKCKFDKSKVKAQVAGCYNYRSGGKTDFIKQLLVSKGPLSIGVAADEWFYYKGGIFSCSSNDLDHAVLLVGYGSEKGKDYWIIKNSWSTGFGEQGYIRVDQQHDCGLSNDFLVVGDPV